MFSKEMFKNVREDVENALSEVEKKYNLCIKAEKIVYEDNSFTLNLRCVRSDIDVQKVEWDKNIQYSFFSSVLKPDDYLRDIIIKGKEYKIIGLKPYNKYSVIVKRIADDKVFLYELSAIKMFLER